MADLNTTIDRAQQISRSVPSTLERRLQTARDRYTRHLQRAGTDLIGAVTAAKRSATRPGATPASSTRRRKENAR